MQTADSFKIGDIVTRDGMVWRIVDKFVTMELVELSDHPTTPVRMNLQGVADSHEFSTANMQRLVPEQS